MKRTPHREKTLERLCAIRAELGSLSELVVVVGGSVPAILNFDLEGMDIRPTSDVDLVMKGSYAQWSKFQSTLRAQGFKQSAESHICKMVKGDLEIDIIRLEDPSLEANEWYAEAHETRVFNEAVGLHFIKPMYLLATKFTAFNAPDRASHGDIYGSRDIEDIVLILLAMPSLREEVGSGQARVHRYVRYELNSQITNMEDALFIIQSHLPGDDATQALAGPLLEWLKILNGGR